jgi:hypothetical protein
MIGFRSCKIRKAMRLEPDVPCASAGAPIRKDFHKYQEGMLQR